MTQAVEITTATPAPASIDVCAPISGEVLGTVPVMDRQAVRDVVSRARAAQRLWAATSFRERAALLVRFRDALVEDTDELVDLLAREAGKPRQEGLLHEVAAVASICSYFAKHGGRLLAPEERPLSLFKHRKSLISYRPRGVVAVIGPWNFPLMLPLRDVLAAVTAGNAAVVKPSEITPLSMLRAKAIWDRSGMPPDLLGVVTGRGETGAELIDAGIDMCVFTGSVVTGKRVAAACGERLIPCVLELGGKAPLIACADCDIERTARAIVGGGFANSGQICLSVERVYAHADIADALVDRVVELTRALRAGDPVTEVCDIGGITFSRQVDVAEAHIADAVARGGRVRCGGKRRAGSRAAFEPTIITNVDHDATVMTEEIFGPVIPIMRVTSDEQAVALANASHLGLNAYIFTEDSVRGLRLAQRLDVGNVLVNDTLANGAMPEAPFGGIKESGFGRVLGREGLRGMCTVKHIMVERMKLPAKNPLSFPYTEGGYRRLRAGLRALYKSGGLLERLSELF